MQHVVAGIDGSASGAAVLGAAAREARCRSAYLEVVSAWTFPPVVQGEQWTEAMQRLATETATAAENQIETTLGPEATRSVKVELSIRSGSPARALLDAAAEADLLVIGRRDKTTVEKFWLGSVADQCVRHATVAVMVVPPPNTGSGVPDGPIVVGLDGSDHSLRALDWAIEEARRCGLHVRAVHCWTESPHALAEAAEDLAEVRALEEDAQTQLDAWIARVHPSGPPAVEACLRWGDPAEALDVEAEEAAMVVVGSRGRGGFAQLVLGSVSRSVVSRADAPVVVIR